MKNIFFILMILLVGCNAGEDKKDERLIEVSINGEVLFKSNCASCHKADKDFVAPALRGALERWGNDKKAMYEFIRNPQKSINTNAYAKQLYLKWNKTSMTALNLSDKELDAIMSYCDSYNLKPVQ
jgi:mono/diheme cytochrome c family protein